MESVQRQSVAAHARAEGSPAVPQSETIVPANNASFVDPAFVGLAPATPVLPAEAAPPDDTGRVRGLRVALALAALGGALAFVAGPVAAGAVLLGQLEATGSPPWGALQGPIGGLLSAVLHGYWGLIRPLLEVVTFAGMWCALLGLIGALRRRCKWWLPLAGLGVGLIVPFLSDRIQDGMFWLGSVSRLDIALLVGGHVAGTLLATGLYLLAFVTVWIVTNGTAAQRTSFGGFNRLSPRSQATGEYRYVERAGRLWGDSLESVMTLGLAPFTGAMLILPVYLAFAEFGWLGLLVLAFGYGILWPLVHGALFAAVTGAFMVGVGVPIAALAALRRRQAVPAKEV